MRFHTITACIISIGLGLYYIANMRQYRDNKGMLLLIVIAIPSPSFLRLWVLGLGSGDVYLGLDNLVCVAHMRQDSGLKVRGLRSTLRLQTGSWAFWGRVSASGARVWDLTTRVQEP